MKRTWLSGMVMVAAVTGTTGLVQADTLGTWLNAMNMQPTDNVKHTWGPLEKSAWKSLPVNIVQTKGVANGLPLCLQESVNGGPRWLGAGVPLQRTGGTTISPLCTSYAHSSTKPGTFFAFDGTKPNPVWVRWDASKPEPRGAVVVATQEAVPRPLYACRGVQPSLAIGYIGDDAKCYMTSMPSSGTTTASSASSYEVLVTSSGASNIEPRYGWVKAAPGYMPFGPMAKVAEPTGPGPNGIVQVLPTPKMHTVCRVRDTNEWWPGYVRETDWKCVYFTWYGQTQKKESAAYEVHRNGNYPLANPYRFNSTGGQPTHACTAFKNGQGPIVGFTKNPQQCTDGSRTDSAQLKLLALPNADHGRG